MYPYGLLDSEYCTLVLSIRFPPAEARRIARKLEVHYTPKHGSWLDIAEIGKNIDKNDAVQSGFIFFAKGKDGIEFGSVVNDGPMPESDFGFNSEEEFLKGMNKLEQQMLSMRDKAVSTLRFFTTP